MKVFRVKIILLTVGLLALACSSSTDSLLRRGRVDMGRFIKEIMNIKISEGQMHSAIWLPFEFNVYASVSDGKSVAEAQKDFAFLKSYLIFLTQSSVTDNNSSEHWADYEDTINRAVLKSSRGTAVEPIKNIPSALRGKLNSLKSFMTHSAQAAENMHILIFPAKDNKNRPMVNAKTRDKLSLVLNEKGRFNEAHFTWRTPFEAVFEGGRCSACGDNVKAKWVHCPWCGNKL